VTRASGIQRLSAIVHKAMAFERAALAIMEDTLAQLRTLREAGKLSQEAIDGIKLREDELASKRKP
jgi:hypothetical protein